VKRSRSSAIVCLVWLGSVPAFGQGNPVYVEVHPNEILVTDKSGSFVAPHTTKAGDTFTSLAKEFYGRSDDARLLAQVAGLPADAVLKPGTRVYMIANNFIVRFDARERAGQLAQALRCGERMTDQVLIAAWDITLPLFSSSGNVGQPTASQLELRLASNRSIILTILFPIRTVMTEILKGTVSAADIRCGVQ
jgi:hypothetical protein